MSEWSWLHADGDRLRYSCGTAFQRISQLHSVLTSAGIPYRMIGGVAVFIHVSERDPLRARMTADVDAAIHRRHLAAAIEAARGAGWVYRRGVDIDMFVDGERPSTRSAVDLLFLDEKIRPEYEEGVPSSAPVSTLGGVLLAPVADLVRMKLTSYRLKDRVHIQDLDAVGLITKEIEASLTELMTSRLAEIRASE